MNHSTEEEWLKLHGSEMENRKQKYLNDPVYKSYLKAVCSYCKRSKGAYDAKELDLKACGGCKLIRYCSVSCQKKDWKFHKSSCSDQTQE